MRTHGLKIDVKAIAEGIFAMIPEDDRVCMVVGMLPAKWMELAERLTRDHIVHLRYPNAVGDELKQLCAAIEPDLINDFMRELSASMLGIATEKGLCIA